MTKARRSPASARARIDSRKPIAFSTRTPSTSSQRHSFDSTRRSRSASVAVPGAGRNSTRRGGMSPSCSSRSATVRISGAAVSVVVITASLFGRFQASRPDLIIRAGGGAPDSWARTTGGPRGRCFKPEPRGRTWHAAIRCLSPEYRCSRSAVRLRLIPDTETTFRRLDAMNRTPSLLLLVLACSLPRRPALKTWRPRSRRRSSRSSRTIAPTATVPTSKRPICDSITSRPICATNEPSPSGRACMTSS